ncbi:putative toxin-antitoxin system toxin component, PIN family [Candidatus Gottesmanbacteria bacterium]|nr:putative toxin-antitoxin system toxin component, PIN family [Candidatus Gottesmanbacteria bacterium]
MSRLAVVDTNVWFSGFFWKGTAFLALERLYTKEFVACFSRETFIEWEQTLFASTQKLGESNRFLVYKRDVKRSALFVEPTEHISVCRDPKDNQFLDVAAASGAAFLVTGDKDLLSPKTFRTTRILTPREFLKQ